MAKLLFVDDHVFERTPGGDVYTVGGKFPYSKWLEYLEFFDEVMVVGRGRSVAEDACGNLALSSGAKVTHHLVDDLSGWRRLFALGPNRRAVQDLVREADAVIARLPSVFGLMACDHAKRARKPYLVELVACAWDASWNHGSLAARLYAPLLVHRTRQQVRKARLVHYVTREFLQRRYPARGGTVGASDVVLVENDPALVARRDRRLNAIRSGERPITFGTIGALFTRLKGIDLAIDALARLGTRFPNATYRVLGEGDPEPFRQKAESAGVGDRVRFDGMLPNGSAVAAWLDEIDVYLQPSYQEGLPRALIEALNQGCLAVGSTAGGIGELLPTERMHRPGDAEGLARRIQDLLETPEEALRQEVRHNIEVASRYSYPRSLAARRRIYAELLRWHREGPSFLPRLERGGGGA